MKNIATQTLNEPKKDGYLVALANWESCKPPYTSSHMKVCVTAAKIILKHLGKPRRSKYEKENYLRLDFSKAGKVTIYAEYPKSMGLKGRKLGVWPELTLPIAREKAQELAQEGLTAESVHQVLDSYESDLWAKVERKKLGEHSFYTYSCRIKQLRESFERREVFSDITYQRLIDILDLWIETKSNNQSFELFGELRRFWKFAAPLHCGGKNIAAILVNHLG